MLLAHELIGRHDAPELVLIHGITQSRQVWHPLLHPLAEHHRVLAVDLRGHGDSESCDPYDPASYASDVIETAQSLGFSDPIIVGHSLGGIVATAYAAECPCAAVVNIDQPLRLSGFKEALVSIEPLLRGDDATFRQTIDAVFAAMNGPLPAAEQARILSHSRVDQEVVLGTWASVLRSTEAELDSMVEAMVAGITVPYLAIHGDDPGPGYAEWLSSLIPTASVEVWPDHGHYPHLVDPARFLARLAEFEVQVRG